MCKMKGFQCTLGTYIDLDDSFSAEVVFGSDSFSAIGSDCGDGSR